MPHETPAYRLGLPRYTPATTDPFITFMNAAGILACLALVASVPLFILLGCQTAPTLEPGPALPPYARVLVPVPDWQIEFGTPVFTFGDGRGHYIELPTPTPAP